MLVNKIFRRLSIRCMLFFFFFVFYFCGILCGFIILRAARLCLNDCDWSKKGELNGCKRRLVRH